MYKPDSLRAFLTAALPQLAVDPDKLLVFIDRGSVASTYAPGLSFEYAYQLNLVLTDFAGDPDAVMAPLCAWLRVHQPEVFPAVNFEADILSNGAVDLSITVDLTERVIVQPRADGGYDITHPPEPQPEARLEAGHWELYLKGELIAEWDQPAV